MLGGEGESTKVNMLKVVDGRRGERVLNKTVKLLLKPVEGKGGLKKTKILTVADVREGGWVKNLIDG